MIPDDFLALLDEKLRRRNERLIAKLLAWANLLDAAGWSVALSGVAGDLWLSEKAKQELQRLGDLPHSWKALLVALNRIPAASVHRKSDDVILWSGQAATQSATGPATTLTRRETEVMAWLREGKTGPEIAIILGCATRTVEKHLANLYQKLGVRNRAEVILKPSRPAN
ncbi:MAG: helix-turn-helix transcriptional regulator [Verrucomicrobiota bacterium]